MTEMPTETPQTVMIGNESLSFRTLARHAVSTSAHYIRSMFEWPDHLRDRMYERFPGLIFGYAPPARRPDTICEFSKSLSLELAQLVRANWHSS
jgi:hypothetical protein